MEEWLDRGMGSCVLRQAELREIVEDGIVERLEEVEVDSYVVMPNHVHAIVKVDGNRSLPHIVKAAKGRSANRLNRALGLKGRLWQSGYWDRIIRDMSHLYRCRRYIERNPTKAGLGKEEFSLKLGEKVYE